MGLLTEYAKARKVSKSLTEFHRTGKTKEEREQEQKPIEDNRDGVISLYVTSPEPDFVPSLPLSGYVSLDGRSFKDIVFRLTLKSPTRLFYLDVVTGKRILGESYGLEMARVLLADAGVGVDDIDTVVSSLADERIPSYFNLPLLTDIISSAGFVGIVYSSPFDRNAFVIWDGLKDILVSAYSLDSGKYWIEV